MYSYQLIMLYILLYSSVITAMGQNGNIPGQGNASCRTFRWDSSFIEQIQSLEELKHKIEKMNQEENNQSCSASSDVETQPLNTIPSLQYSSTQPINKIKKDLDEVVLSPEKDSKPQVKYTKKNKNNIWLMMCCGCK